MQFAASCNLKRFSTWGVGDFDGHIAFGLFHQAITNDARLHLAAFTSSKRAIVDAKGHCDGGGVDGLRLKRFINRQCTKSVGNGGLAHTRDGDDIAWCGLINLLLSQTAEGQDFGHAELFDFLSHTR